MAEEKIDWQYCALMGAIIAFLAWLVFVTLSAGFEVKLLYPAVATIFFFLASVLLALSVVFCFFFVRELLRGLRK